MNSVCIAFANGCPRSRVDTAKLFSYFEQNGWKVIDKIKEADLVVVATCGVSEYAEKKSLRLLARTRRRMKKEAQLFVTGCLAKIGEQSLKAFGETVYKPMYTDMLDSAINATVKLNDVADPNRVSDNFLKAQQVYSYFDRFASEFSFSRRFLHKLIHRIIPLKHRLLVQEPHQQDVYSIRVAKGCMEECSYCAIRFAEGTLRSKPIKQVMEEFEKGLKSDFKIFTLVASDLGSYGQDIGTNVAELLRAMLKNNRQFKLHLKDFGPKWFVRYQSELTAVLAENRERIGNIMLPVQSGSNRILAKMRRGYTAEQIAESFCRLKEEAKGIRVSTHVLVGFPGETNEDFAETLALLKKVQFDRIDIYTYSDRPGTESSQMPDKVPLAIKNCRVHSLRRTFREVAEFVS